MRISDELRAGLLGALGGAIVIGVAGFTVGGWMTGGSATAMAKVASNQALVLAFADVCVHQFNTQPDAAAKLEVIKSQSSYEASMNLEGAGFATMPGQSGPTAGVGMGCATKLKALG
jgi:hypothetical protein